MLRHVSFLSGLLILISFFTGAVLATESPHFYLDVNSSETVLSFTGDATPPESMDVCRFVLVAPGWGCVRELMYWEETNNSFVAELEPNIYYIGEGTGEYYFLSDAALVYGWNAAPNGFTWTETEGFHEFELDRVNGSLTYAYTGNRPGWFPLGIHYCKITTAYPGYFCGFDELPVWQIGGNYPELILDAGTYFVGSGASPRTYVLGEGLELGWSLLTTGEGFFYEEPVDPPSLVYQVFLPLVAKPPVVHVFSLEMSGENLLYVYKGNSPEDFPKFINYCKYLTQAPWYSCSYVSNPIWEGNELTLEGTTYFIGTGVGSGDVKYELSQEMIALGWSLTPSQDGFVKD